MHCALSMFSAETVSMIPLSSLRRSATGPRSVESGDDSKRLSSSEEIVDSSVIPSYSRILPTSELDFVGGGVGVFPGARRVNKNWISLR